MRHIFASRLNGDGRLTALTNESITSLPDLLSELASIREKGFAEEHGEAAPGRACIAVPVPSGQPFVKQAAISISMGEVRFAELKDKVVELLLETKNQIERETQGRAAMGEPSIAHMILGGDF